MGLYDTFLSKDPQKEVQLKITENMTTYKIGDKVEEIPDGIYFGYGGVVVIVNSTYIGFFDEVYDKWGGIYPVEPIFFKLMRGPKEDYRSPKYLEKLVKELKEE